MNTEFDDWWSELINNREKDGGGSWHTLERIAAHDAWDAASKNKDTLIRELVGALEVQDCSCHMYKDQETKCCRCETLAKVKERGYE